MPYGHSGPAAPGATPPRAAELYYKGFPICQAILSRDGSRSDSSRKFASVAVDVLAVAFLHVKGADWKYYKRSSTQLSCCSRRMATVEPVFANLRHHKGMSRFTLRGKAKVSTQWQLYCLVHNIEKIARRH